MRCSAMVQLLANAAIAAFTRRLITVPTTCPAYVAKFMSMATIVICTALLIFGASITLYSEDGWMLLFVAIILAAAFFFVALS